MLSLNKVDLSCAVRLRCGLRCFFSTQAAPLRICRHNSAAEMQVSNAEFKCSFQSAASNAECGIQVSQVHIPNGVQRKQEICGNKSSAATLFSRLPSLFPYRGPQRAQNPFKSPLQTPMERGGAGRAFLGHLVRSLWAATGENIFYERLTSIKLSYVIY